MAKDTIWLKWKRRERRLCRKEKSKPRIARIIADKRIRFGNLCAYPRHSRLKIVSAPHKRFRHPFVSIRVLRG
jgi:hypothetical protein